MKEGAALTGVLSEASAWVPGLNRHTYGASPYIYKATLSRFGGKRYLTCQ